MASVKKKSSQAGKILGGTLEASGKGARKTIEGAGKAAADIAHASLNAGTSTILSGLRGIKDAARKQMDNSACTSAVRSLQKMTNEGQTGKVMKKVDQACGPATEKHCEEFRQVLERASEKKPRFWGRSQKEIMEDSNEARMCS